MEDAVIKDVITSLLQNFFKRNLITHFMPNLVE